MSNEQLQPHYDCWFPPVRFYWHRVISGVAQQIEANEKELILDFGCGRQLLKKYLPRHNVIGYDIVKEYSDISDYTILLPHTIVCSHALEHMNMQELVKTINDFKKMKAKFIITAQPTENWLSKIFNLIGRRECLREGTRVFDHKLRIHEIHNFLLENYALKARQNILTLTIISKWIPK